MNIKLQRIKRRH